MKRTVAVLAWVLALSVGAWAQEGGDKKEAAKPAAQEKGKEGGAGGVGSLPVAEVDTNGDGRISLAELKAALARLSSGSKEGVKEGGERKAPVRKDGEGQKKPGVGDGGEGQKKPGTGDGNKEGGEKKPDGAGVQKKEGDK